MRFTRKYGGITIVAARFMPFLRTFAPFVAGVAQMTRSKFTFFDVTGRRALGGRHHHGRVLFWQHPLGQVTIWTKSSGR
jgi:hypothetical protein